MKTLFFVALLLVAVSAMRPMKGGMLNLPKQMKLFQDFMTQYGKSYSQEEFGARFQIFSDNLKAARALQKAETGSAKYGVTKFMDLSPEEFRADYLMPKEMYADFKIDESRVMAPLPKVEVPSSFDWRDKNAVTPVYNQGQCGSCWAFSATETIESFHFLAGKTLIGLSMQQIVDCDTQAYGCNGGWTYVAYNYVEKAGGIDTLSSYPYTAEDGNCAFNPSNVGAKITGWKYVTQSDNENDMLNTILQTGPLSVCVDASSWQYYQGGVIQNCGQSIDHCVQVTGFSTQQGIDAWNVRNSWGTDWGIQGYLYVARGNDVCAIGNVVTIVSE